LAARAIAEAPPDQRQLRIRPRPPRPADLEAAEAAIEAAFETVYSGTTTDEERLAAIEASHDLVEVVREARDARRRFRGTTEMDISVEAVRFLGVDEAEVRFVLLFPSPVLPRIQAHGYARLIGGRWKVSRRTFCALVQSLGVLCPPEQP
jgi:hypothetical protein